MKNLFFCLVVLTIMVSIGNAAEKAVDLRTEQQKRSYAIGANVAKNIKLQEVAVDPSLVAQGLLDELAGKSLLSEAELGAIMQKLQGEVRQKMMAEQQRAAVENKRKGQEFLAENKKRDGVQTLPSGLQYKVLSEGNGRKPTVADTVLCNYRGSSVDGRTFDASQPGKPVAFKVAGVIPGWQEALKRMPVGSRWQLVIPPELAYGEGGAGNAIGPNETLIFELELTGIQ